MRASERRAEIDRILGAGGEVKVVDLAERLHVTPSTIRRDLDRLRSEGRLTRTYGGAVGGGHPGAGPAPHERAMPARRQKDLIGRWAAAQIRDGETVLLDAGTTTGRVAHHLRDRQRLTVVTNGLTPLIELAQASRVEVIVLGGSFRRTGQGFVGPLTELTLSRLSADKVFLGADGLVGDRGICESSLVQARCKELMAECGREVFVLADASKIGRAPYDAWAPLDRPYTLVTDSGVTEDQLAPFRERGHVSIVVVPVPVRPRSGNRDEQPGE
ncbi:MAG: DeoR/GlpR transcriptional regulator [Micromonosporaceae bacterium]|jgi:DeoR/GlpR family transcriptional regulator of sugar metabolism|nr:DeoR/GlpR transcriptional regulator [Micromonosporaceae bacterium]